MGQPGGRIAPIAVIYCRVSTNDQSCERQARDLRAFAERAGYQIAGLFMETESGARNDRAERKKVMALAQHHEIGAILVTELSRWGRNSEDLLQTLAWLESYQVSLIAKNGFTFDVTTAHGPLLATIIAGLSAFERELMAERIRSGMAAAKSRGKRFGRQAGECPSDRHAVRVMKLIGEGQSYRAISREIGLHKSTVAAIVERQRGKGAS